SNNSRGQSLGKKMLLAVHNYVKKQNASALYCHAQMHVKQFYEKVGYQTCGEPFEEAGVEHIMMKKYLN
ncbi:GNAT family N-acetyltransferase, partial [Lactobacillus helveticus]|uniref:GNAT family N-acetyltransferase n=1 Tax=Lactobacillus helveticus TaxID=1587 RepID=UPI0032F09541